MKQRNWLTYIILILLAIGIVFSILENFLMVLLPVVILGGIYLLYKYPPSFLNKKNTSHYRSTYIPPQQTKTKRDKPRSKNVPFKVIDGGKDDENTPTYH